MARPCCRLAAQYACSTRRSVSRLSAGPVSNGAPVSRQVDEMRDDAVEARLIAGIGIVALAARIRSQQRQLGVGERGARLAADDFQVIRRTRRIARRRHRAGHLDRRAGGRFQEDGGHGLPHHVGNGARAAGGDHTQFAAEEAHDVQMVDQHLGDHQPLLVLRVGLAHEQRPKAGGVRQQSGRERRHAREDQVTELARGDPALELAIPRPEPPVLVRHEARLAVDPADERLRLGERRRQRLLAQHVDAASGGGIDPSGVRFPRRNDVECVDRLGGEHRLGIAIDVRDRELLGALGGFGLVGIADRDEAHALAQIAPADEVIPADHPGARQRHLQRLRFRELHGHQSSPQSRRGGADCATARAPGPPHPAASATAAAARPHRSAVWER